MLTAAEAREAIQTAFFATWAFTTPIAWDGDDFDPTKIDVAWVRLSVQFTTGALASLGGAGSRFYRSFGLVFVQVYTPLGADTASANDVLAQTAKDIFKGVQLTGGLWFRNASIVTIGVEGKWYQQNVSAEFQYDETE